MNKESNKKKEKKKTETHINWTGNEIRNKWTKILNEKKKGEDENRYKRNRKKRLNKLTKKAKVKKKKRKSDRKIIHFLSSGIQ